jgi:hypothetical protein
LIRLSNLEGVNDVMEQKIAVIITAHSNPTQLLRLCKHLTEEFDVYLHLDMASRLEPEDFLVSPRIWVQKKFGCDWGNPGIVNATLSLLALAEANLAGYDRYIMISGQDVPLKTNSEIRELFETYPDENFMGCRKVLPGEKLMSRVSQFHWKPANKSRGITWLIRVLVSRSLSMVQYFLPPRSSDYEIYFGECWMDLTGKTVREILELVDTTPEFLARFKHTLIAEEMFFHTATHALGSGICGTDQLLRYIDWTTGPEYPRTLRMADLENLSNSNAVFARKLDEKVDSELIESLYSRL